ncbi:hypothetical protein [Pedobacter panaciterrae]|jgi:hypothetical protein|uniref:Uncharacterized protein n=1 Tax=Pedobacter panaciterrae TaxID=363849 RepID=A0ABU8NFZ3_9SPHI|nr:hypothetical protein [Pedobacter panaciterrae]NQX56946.1 hypothetical protein [Pedobacter panaciterrae]
MNKFTCYLFALTLNCLCTKVVAQNKPVFDGPSWKPPYQLELDGWGIERFPIPIDFAPSITYTGVEDIRFTKGWSNQKSPEYWSYAFLWLLDNAPVQTTVILQKNLNAYYDGLVDRNITKRNIPKALIIKTETKLRAIKTEKGDMHTFQGTIRMLDYMAQKPILLNAKIHIKKCPGSMQIIVFYQLSPKPLTKPIWTKLNALWSRFKCGG